MNELIEAVIQEDKLRQAVSYLLDRNPFHVCPSDAIVIIPSDHTLVLDIDTEDQYQIANERIAKLYNETGLSFSIQETISKGGYPHRHMYLTSEFGPMSIWQRIALQSILGSDPKKEMLSAMRVITNSQHPICMFEPIPKVTD